MKTLLIVTSMLFLCAVGAQARLGETPEQIEKRFGAPTFKGVNSNEYRKNGFEILVIYKNGVSVAEHYANKGITETDVKRILSGQDAAGWTDYTKDHNSVAWQSVTSRHLAIWYKTDGRLSVTTRAEVDAGVEKRKKATEGF